MPWGPAAAAVAGAVTTKVLNGSSGGGGGGSPAYVPQNQLGADTNFLQNKDQYQNTLQDQYNTTNPYNQALLQGQVNNPYQQGMQQHANIAGNQLALAGEIGGSFQGAGWSNVANQYNAAQNANEMYLDGKGKVQQSTTDLYNMAGQSNQNYQALMDYQKGQLGNIQGSQNNLYGAGNQVLQAAQDPQNALYNRTQQQLTEQSRAAQYARGIQSSPYGAALENSANENFNIDWQNQQLARQAQGIQAAQGAYGSAQGMGNSYTSTQAGLQSGKNEQYAGLTNAAQNQWTNYINAGGQMQAMNNQNIGAAQNNAFGLANQAAQASYAGGQLPYGANQQAYGNQNQAVGNFQQQNQSYLQGLNQLQSNDLGYMNNAQGAQNQAFNQNAYNNNQQQQAIGSIAGPLGNAIKNTDWSGLQNTVGGWFSGGDDYTGYGDASFY